MTNGKGSKAGVVEAAKRNPNKTVELNGAPEGPYSHMMGHTGDGGMKGDTSASGKNGETFEFK